MTGWIFDYLCLLWGESCGKRGRCQIYDIKKLSLAITVLGCIMKGKVSGGHSYCHHQSNKYRTASDFFNDGR